MEQLYSYKRAAELLDISVRTLKRLIVKNQLSIVYVGERVRVKESSLEKLVVAIKSLDDHNINL